MKIRDKIVDFLGNVLRNAHVTDDNITKDTSVPNKHYVDDNDTIKTSKTIYPDKEERTTATADIGGLAAGTSVSGKKANELLALIAFGDTGNNQMLYKEPKITSITFDPNSEPIFGKHIAINLTINLEFGSASSIKSVNYIIDDGTPTPITFNETATTIYATINDFVCDKTEKVIKIVVEWNSNDYVKLTDSYNEPISLPSGFSFTKQDFVEVISPSFVLYKETNTSNETTPLSSTNTFENLIDGNGWKIIPLRQNRSNHLVVSLSKNRYVQFLVQTISNPRIGLGYALDVTKATKTWQNISISNSNKSNATSCKLVEFDRGTQKFNEQQSILYIVDVNTND